MEYVDLKDISQLVNSKEKYMILFYCLNLITRFAKQKNDLNSPLFSEMSGKLAT